MYIFKTCYSNLYARRPRRYPATYILLPLFGRGHSCTISFNKTKYFTELCSENPKLKELFDYFTLKPHKNSKNTLLEYK